MELEAKVEARLDQSSTNKTESSYSTESSQSNAKVPRIISNSGSNSVASIKLFEVAKNSTKVLLTALSQWLSSQDKESFDLVQSLYTNVIDNTNEVLNLCQTNEHCKENLAKKGLSLDALLSLSAPLKEGLEIFLAHDEDDDQNVRNRKRNTKLRELELILGAWNFSLFEMQKACFPASLRLNLNSSTSNPDVKGNPNTPATPARPVSAEYPASAVSNFLYAVSPARSNRPTTPLSSVGALAPAASPWDKTISESNLASNAPSAQLSNIQIIFKNLESIFLQIDETVKKVSFAGNLSFSSLKMLFMEKFAFSGPPGEAFPRILIQHPVTHIFYDLEDLEEVKENCVLKLYTPIDSKDFIVKQIEMGFINLQREMKEFRRAFQVTTGSTIQATSPDGNNGAFKGYSLVTNSSSNLRRQSGNFESAKRTMSKGLSELHLHLQAQQAAAAGKTIDRMKLEKLANGIVDFRQDLAALRQYASSRFRDNLLSDVRTIKETIEIFRASNPPSLNSARIELNQQKEKFIKDSDSISKRMNDLQELLEDLKSDVTQRRCQPGEARMTLVLKEALAIQQGLSSLHETVDEIKPKWKKTWETELQAIVAEQQLLKDRANAITEMEEDQEGLMEMMESIKQIVELQSVLNQQRKDSGQKRPNFVPPPPDENFEGMNTILQEIQTVETNSASRMEAIARAERIRTREREFKEDPFSKELKTFINLDRLHKTGGVSEIDRLREKKNKETLLNMLRN